MPSRLLFKYAALLTGLLLSKDLCLPGAAAEEPGFPETSAVMVIVDPTCDRFDAFTSEYLPTARSEVVWVDGPEFGYFDYDHNSRLMLYIPAPLNRDSIDTFVVYATNEQGDWDIASFFFDPATREMTFAANISIKPAIQGEKAGLDDSGKPSSPSIPGIYDVPLLYRSVQFWVEDQPQPAFPRPTRRSGTPFYRGNELWLDDITRPSIPPSQPRPSIPPSRWIPQRPSDSGLYDVPWSQPWCIQIEDLPQPTFPQPTRRSVTPPSRHYDLWLDDIAQPRPNSPK